MALTFGMSCFVIRDVSILSPSALFQQIHSLSLYLEFFTLIVYNDDFAVPVPPLGKMILGLFDSDRLIVCRLPY